MSLSLQLDVSSIPCQGEEIYSSTIESDYSSPEPQPNEEGKLTTNGRKYTFTSKSPEKKDDSMREYVLKESPKPQSPMNLSSHTQKSPQPQPHSQNKENSFVRAEPPATLAKERASTSTPSLAAARPSTPQPQAKEVTPRASNPSQKSHPSSPSSTPLASRNWEREETMQWWQTRYHQKEREGQRQGQDQREQQQQEENKKKRAVSAIGSISASTSEPSLQNGGTQVAIKPLLEQPNIGVFALYYILTKIGILSDGTSNFSYKQEIETIESETTSAHKKRLAELKLAMEHEQQASRWSVFNTVFSWMGALSSLFTGVVLVATGAGAIAGALLIAGGLIQVTSQILEITGGWKKIAELLPGDNVAKKRAVVMWMQIGIGVLCFILSGAGALWSGYANFGEAGRTANALFSCIANIGQGVTAIGTGITMFMSKNKISDVKRYEKIIAELKHKRRDLMDQADSGIDRLQQLFEDLARALDFEVELFNSDQIVYR